MRAAAWDINLLSSSYLSTDLLRIFGGRNGIFGALLDIKNLCHQKIFPKIQMETEKQGWQYRNGKECDANFTLLDEWMGDLTFNFLNTQIFFQKLLI